MATNSKFTKSLENKGTEKAGLSLLLVDPRFQVPNLATKRRIVELIGKPQTSFGTQTFDAVMTPKAEPPIAVENVDGLFPELRLIEMKTTRKPIQNAALNGFFFGATEREYEMAQTLGERYLFAFIVPSSANEFSRPFAVLLTLDEVKRRTRLRRTQYQVNFHNDMTPGPAGSKEEWLILLGVEMDIPPT